MAKDNPTAFYGCNDCGQTVGVADEAKIPKDHLCDECHKKPASDAKDAG